ncbi:MAG: MFS transporter, partial [Chloroflexota bacterium]
DGSMWTPRQKCPRVFYGWWIVGASLFISLFTGGVVSLGFTAVFEPIASEFGWSYTQISVAASLIGLETGLLSPLLGFLADRWGSRRIVFTGTGIVGLGLIALSRINSLGTFYGAFVIIATGMSMCTSPVFMTAVANWFRRNVSMASGIAACGFALGGLVVPLVAVLTCQLK